MFRTLFSQICQVLLMPPKVPSMIILQTGTYYCKSLKNRRKLSDNIEFIKKSKYICN